MNRRNFLLASSMAVAAGTILPSALKAFGKNGLAASNEENFSLEVITDNPDKASAMLEKFAKEGNFQTTNLKYAEYSVSGNAVGDIVLVKNERLIDFTKSNDSLSQGLKEIRSTLKLPSLISNPVRVPLFTKSDNDAKPTGKPVEMVVAVIVGFKDGKISHEHIYWDQAGILVQVGLLDPKGLPVCGAESARKVLDPSLPARVM
ncbi:unnamed protein product [Rotaria sp. Silwood1]|nr:unnamed protein product [Rotaria sp. Silwood1]